MYTIEKNLLHLQLGAPPKRDFAPPIRDAASRIGGAAFYNEFHQNTSKIN